MSGDHREILGQAVVEVARGAATLGEDRAAQAVGGGRTFSAYPRDQGDDEPREAVDGVPRDPPTHCAGPRYEQDRESDQPRGHGQ